MYLFVALQCSLGETAPILHHVSSKCSCHRVCCYQLHQSFRLKLCSNLALCICLAVTPNNSNLNKIVYFSHVWMEVWEGSPGLLRHCRVRESRFLLCCCSLFSTWLQNLHQLEMSYEHFCPLPIRTLLSSVIPIE